MTLEKQKKALIFGASGMAGQSFVKRLKRDAYDVLGLSRSGPDIFVDALTELELVHEYIDTLKPDLIINCAAIVSLSHCQSHPREASRINAELPRHLAHAASTNGSRLIQISTDHFYSGDGDKRHSENDPVTLLNKYAETKYQGEQNALQHTDTLVVRTNITGFRGDPKRPTFVEWLTDSLLRRAPLRLFTDFYTSTIDTNSLSRLCTHQNLGKVQGIVNIASSSPITKSDFAHRLAKELGVDLNWAEDASVFDLDVRRAESLGLNCDKAEQILGIAMPSPDEVIRKLARKMS